MNPGEINPGQPDQYVNSPDEAYESTLSPESGLGGETLGDPNPGESKIVALERAEALVREIAESDGTRSEYLKAELDFLNIDMTTAGWESEFVTAHRNFMDSLKSQWEETLGNWISVVPQSVARDAAVSPAEEAQLTQLYYKID